MPLNQKVPFGPFWPLGQIVVPTPGTPVAIMSVVDPSAFYDPTTASDTPGSSPQAATAHAILVQPLKANVGSCYLVMRNGTKTDTSTIIARIDAGVSPLFLNCAEFMGNEIGLWALSLDADTANDGCQITAVIA